MSRAWGVAVLGGLLLSVSGCYGRCEEPTDWVPESGVYEFESSRGTTGSTWSDVDNGQLVVDMEAMTVTFTYVDVDGEEVLTVLPIEPTP